MHAHLKQVCGWVGGVAFAFTLTGCFLFYSRAGLHVSAPPTPVAIEGINSPWDDFNVAKPANWKDFMFATNRGSEGKHFDIWFTEVSWDEHPQVLRQPMVFSPSLMSSADERGPLFINENLWNRGSEYQENLVLTSNREGGPGGLDLYWAANCGSNSESCEGPLRPLEGLNSPANDAYLSMPFAGRRSLFASDRAGHGYDIYEATWPADRSLAEPPTNIRLASELSSDTDDNAPYVFAFEDTGTEVVFASKRVGGVGEYDLWCSRFDGKMWRSPVHLPHGVNSMADEFRPIVFELSDARFLVFSSNRPGGQGGYDLYAVRYPGCSDKP